MQTAATTHQSTCFLVFTPHACARGKVICSFVCCCCCRLWHENHQIWTSGHHGSRKVLFNCRYCRKTLLLPTLNAWCSLWTPQIVQIVPPNRPHLLTTPNVMISQLYCACSPSNPSLVLARVLSISKSLQPFWTVNRQTLTRMRCFSKLMF